MFQKRSSLLIGFLVVCGLALAANSSLRAQPGASQAGHDLLLVFKNGNLQRGRIERQVGGFTVLTPSGSRLVIRSEQVDFVCSSLEEALELKRSRLAPIDPQSNNRPTDRIDFFQWCLKQGMYDAAEQELTQLQLSRLPASELYALLRQLHTAIERANKPKTEFVQPAAPANGSAPAVTVAQAKPEIMFSDLPTAGPRLGDVPLGNRTLASEIASGEPPVVRGELIKPVAFEEPLPNQAAATLPVYQLEETLKQLPVEGVSLFKRRVEPMLFKNCSNAGCHDPDKTRLPLQRLARGEGIPKRMSQQNLVQVLRFAGTGLEGNSPLLAAATTAHGPGSQPPLKKDSDQYRLLAAWVERMAPSLATAGIPQTESRIFPPALAPSQDLPPTDAQPLTAIRPEQGKLAPDQAQGSGLTPLPAPVIPDLNRADSKFVPTDPFDPEIFNRRVKARSGSAAGGPQNQR